MEEMPVQEDLVGMVEHVTTEATAMCADVETLDLQAGIVKEEVRKSTFLSETNVEKQV